jgi:hypothetical protein
MARKPNKYAEVKGWWLECSEKSTYRHSVQGAPLDFLFSTRRSARFMACPHCKIKRVIVRIYEDEGGRK